MRLAGRRGRDRRLAATRAAPRARPGAHPGGSDPRVHRRRRPRSQRVRQRHRGLELRRQQQRPVRRRPVRPRNRRGRGLHRRGEQRRRLGTCPNCMVLPLRVGESFVTDANRFAEAALYATDSGADVIQEALGTVNDSAVRPQAIEYAYDHGVTGDRLGRRRGGRAPQRSRGRCPTRSSSTRSTKYSSLTELARRPTSSSTAARTSGRGSRCRCRAARAPRRRPGKSAGVAGLIYSAAQDAVARAPADTERGLPPGRRLARA